MVRHVASKPCSVLCLVCLAALRQSQAYSRVAQLSHLTQLERPVGYQALQSVLQGRHERHRAHGGAWVRVRHLPRLGACKQVSRGPSTSPPPVVSYRLSLRCGPLQRHPNRSSALLARYVLTFTTQQLRCGSTLHRFVPDCPPLLSSAVSVTMGSVRSAGALVPAPRRCAQ